HVLEPIALHMDFMVYGTTSYIVSTAGGVNIVDLRAPDTVVGSIMNRRNEGPRWYPGVRWNLGGGGDKGQPLTDFGAPIEMPNDTDPRWRITLCDEHTLGPPVLSVSICTNCGRVTIFSPLGDPTRCYDCGDGIPARAWDEAIESLPLSRRPRPRRR
ncbi:MAG: hypothetical protein AAB865_02720, partial [Patescibacteria group bacterium]